MSKQQKALEKLRSKPVPTDFTWIELKNIMEDFGFKMLTASGSRRRFRHEEKDLNFFLHEPHPHKTILVCYIRETIKFLKDHGFIR